MKSFVACHTNGLVVLPSGSVLSYRCVNDVTYNGSINEPQGISDITSDTMYNIHTYLRFIVTQHVAHVGYHVYTYVDTYICNIHSIRTYIHKGVYYYGFRLEKLEQLAARFEKKVCKYGQYINVYIHMHVYT